MTKIIVLVLVALTAVLDIILLAKGGHKDSISYFLYINSKQYPMIPFSFGVLIGHIFWPMRGKL